jgi:phenylacetate-coenzyme A ligase PaaK-like adenylate-forming protein
MAMAVATEGHFISRLVATFQPLLARPVMQMRAFSVMQPMPALAAALDRYRPHYLHGYPSFLEALAWAKLEGALSIEPEFISLGSEPFSASARALLGRAFPGAEVSETYGATECLPIANQCRLGGLHLNTDVCVLEPVDAAGRPVPDGEASEKVFLTNLLNRGQPLIRYELRDSVTVLGVTCPCGAGLPLIRVEGRSDDTFYLADASGRLHACPPVPFEVLFLDLPGLVQYQLVHARQNVLEVRFVPASEADPAHVAAQLRERFRSHLARIGLDGAVRVELERVEAIEREPGGHKLRQIRSLVARPAMPGSAGRGEGEAR